MMFGDVRKYLLGYYRQIQEHNEIIQKQYNMDEFKFYIKGVNNPLAMASEITDNYISRITSGKSSITPALLRQRLKNVYRDILFIPTMSVFEYSFIKSLLLCTDLNASKKIRKTGSRNVKFSKLLKWVNEDELINDNYIWVFSSYLRNDIVHYDAICRHTMDCPQIDFPISMVEGKMSEGVLRSFISLAKALEDSFFNFITKLPVTRT